MERTLDTRTLTKKTRIWPMAVGLAAAVAVVPPLFPTGPDSSLDAARFLEGGHLVVGALIVFLGGLLTALTPCVYPLIPITVSVFGARKAESRGKAILLTSAYVVGMGAVFSVLGMVAAKTGQAFGSQLGRPAFVLGLAAVMVLLATSMFGAFELNLPPALMQRLNGVGGAGLAGAFLMGTVSGFLAAPCTGPVLAGLLAFVTKTQSMALGGTLLFIYALGIGVPFFAIGAFAIQLPKGGVWMEWVKSALGIMLLALAALYLKPVFAPLRLTADHAASVLGRHGGVAVAAAIVVVGVFLGAIHRSFKEGPRDFALKGLGVLLVVGALVLRIGALDAPDRGTLFARAGAGAEARGSALNWSLHYAGDPGAAATFEEALRQAKASGRPVMIDFFAEWCAACKELDRETYVAGGVIGESDRFTNIKVDSTNATDTLDALNERFGIVGLPTVVFISSRGEVLKDPRVTGFLGPEKFVAEQRKVR